MRRSLARSGLLLLWLCLGMGCTTPINITAPQPTTLKSTGESSTGTPATKPYVERWSIITYERIGPNGKSVKRATVAPIKPWTSNPLANRDNCPPFKLPKLPKAPPLPAIPPEKRNDEHYISNVLIDHEQELIKHIQRINDILNDAYAKYQAECQKKSK